MIPAPLRVVESYTRLRPTTNPYLVQLARALEAQPGVEVSSFDWRRVLLGRYDVLHVHWPEQLMGGHSLQGRLARRLLCLMLCLRLAMTRVALVRTWHNLERPSGLGWWDHRLLDLLDRATTLRIRLNDRSPMPESAPYVTILHGDYRSWFGSLPHSRPVPGRAAYVGLVRRYKNLEDLLEAFSAIEDPALSLQVSGSPSSDDLAASVLARCEADPRVSARLEFLDDADFVTAVTAAELVVLPYRHMHNSGAVLAALSLRRPVLVPDNDVNRDLACEVGDGWVRTFKGSLDGPTLAAALSVGIPDGEPDLSRRTWISTGAEHVAAFREAARVRRT
jgi:glycosyltransferase involved in cell wall biosynthesis